MKTVLALSFLFIVTSVPCVHAQQVPDTLFLPKVSAPAYKPGEGPVVLLDEAHYNFHTMKGRYAPFSKVLQRDGYRVKASGSKITRAVLDGASILVIANALSVRNEEDWILPTPSAFDASEIAAIKEWVARGGSLWLIADHMPFPGAAESLAAEFGVLMCNGFALNPDSENAALTFSYANRLLADHPVTRGRNATERVDSVVSFTGQGFRLEGKGDPLMTIGKGIRMLMPVVAWEFTKLTPSTSATGMLQGAVLRHEKGRVAVFGEAAMFSAQLAGTTKRPMGMNDPTAKHNAQFMLNVAHWLSGLL